jgi:hypothetical protein
MDGCEIQAPRRRCTNKWGTANVHVADGFDAIGPGEQIMHDIVMRQLSLVDNLDDPGVIRVQPDGAKV